MPWSNSWVNLLLNMLRARGFTFLEVLVSLAVLSIALLGMDGLQWRMMQAARYQTLTLKAQQLALGLVARYRINPSAALSAKTKAMVEAVLPQGRYSINEKRVIVSWGAYAPAACHEAKQGRVGCVIVNIS